MKTKGIFFMMLIVFAQAVFWQGCSGKYAEPDSSIKNFKSDESNKNENFLDKGEDDMSMNGMDEKKPILTYLGHASVKLKTSNGTVIYIDPFAGTDYSEPADILLVTHSHSDHDAVDKVTLKDNGTLITHKEALKDGKYQSFNVHNIKISATPAYNKNHPKDSCVGFILEFDEIKLYHAGDTSNIPEMEELSGQNITYAMLPMDGVYNMGPNEASEAAKRINAKHNIPIHTGPNGIYSEKNISNFKAENKLVLKPGDKIELEK